MGLSRRALLLAATGVPFARAAEVGGIACPLPASPAVLIPGLSNDPGTRFVGSKLYRGLLRWSADGTQQPDLATAIDVSDDGLTYTCHLRPGVTWHDSGGFTSEDVAFSLTRFHRALQPRLRLDRVKVALPDPLTAVLTLPSPDAAFLRRLDALSLPIVPRHVHDQPGWALDPRRTTPVGTGPFRVADWLHLVRFDWYAGPRPALASIAFPILSDPAARLALLDSDEPALLAGEAVDLPTLPRLRMAAGVVVEGDASPATARIAGLRVNPQAKPLDQMEVRLALACAIDRQAALREAWAGLGRIATGPVVAGSVNANRAAGTALPDYGLATAAGHFDAAGLRPDDAGVRARLTVLSPPGGPWPAMLALARRSLGQVGIDLVAEPVTVAEWARRVANRDYQLAAFADAQTGDPAVDLPPYAVGQPDIAGLLSGSDEAVQQAQLMLVQRMAAIWLVEPAMPVVRDRRLRLPDGVFGNFAGAILA